jgi:hypothetical protein
LSVKLPMTIGAKHGTFIQFAFNCTPAPGIPFAGNTKVFLTWIPVMKFKRFYAAIIATPFTLVALIVYCHLADLFSPFMDSFYKVLPSVAVFAFVFLHRLLCAPCTRSLPLTRAQPHALPAELQGNNMLKNSDTAFGTVLHLILGLTVPYRIPL